MEKSKKLGKRVYLVGPHSSGKTTLANALSKYYTNSVPMLQETARQVLQWKGYTKADIESERCLDMQLDIFLAQFKAEESLIEKYGSDVTFISDRAGIDPIIYAMKYSPFPLDWCRICELKEWEVLGQRYMNPLQSLVILVEPCKEFLKDDGTRKMPRSWDEWQSFNKMYAKFLKNQKIPFKTIGESCRELKSRVHKVVSWVDQDHVTSD